MEQDEFVKALLLGAGVWLVYRMTQSNDVNAFEPLTTIANGAGVTVSSQAVSVPIAPSLPGVVPMPSAMNNVNANTLANIAAMNGYPAPQAFTVSVWNYFYTLITGSTQTPQADNGVKLTAQQYTDFLQRAGYINLSDQSNESSGLQGVKSTGRRYGKSLGAVNNSYERGAVQSRGLAPIHGWE